MPDTTLDILVYPAGRAVSNLVVIVPSRGRPERARTLVEVFRNTCTADTTLCFAVDDDDPTAGEYETVGDGVRSGTLTAPSRTMVQALNIAATNYATTGVFAVGFMGDDHMPRTHGWDEAYLDTLRDMGTGIVYGNDLLQRGNLPTQCAMTSDIIRALGYMAPPTLLHLAVDNWWLELGRGAGCIRYLDGVIVEHRHPVAGKARWDDGYSRVNSPHMYQRDLAEMARLRRTDLPAAVAAIRALRAGTDG